MNTENYSFLPLLITEPIYLIDRPVTNSQPVQSTSPVNTIQTTPALAVNKEIPASSAVASVPKIFKDVVVVMSKEDEAKKAFLEKILLAVNINFSEVTVYQSISAIPAEVQFKKALCFGEKVPSVPLYTPSAYKSGQILLANPLAEIESDVNKKKQLWSCLQSIFPKN